MPSPTSLPKPPRPRADRVRGLRAGWRPLAVSIVVVAALHWVLLDAWSAVAGRPGAASVAALQVRLLSFEPHDAAVAPAPARVTPGAAARATPTPLPGLVRVSTQSLPLRVTARVPAPRVRARPEAAAAPTEPLRDPPAAVVAEPARDVAPAAEPTAAEPPSIATQLAAAPVAASTPPAPVTSAVERPVDPPLYPTRPPTAQVLHYRLSKGALSGTGELAWQPGASGYRLSLRAGMPLISVLLEQTSEGRFDARGLAPLRHTDRRWRRSERAISFERGADGSHGVIRYSVAESPRGLPAGAQDRVSWIVQLAAIVRAWPGGAPPPGSQIEIWVAAVAGDLQHWVLRVEPADTTGDTAGLLRLVREATTPHETRAEVWLDPKLQHLPRRLRLTDSGGESLELVSTDGN